MTITEANPEDARTLAYIKQITWLTSYTNEEYGITEADVKSKEFECEKLIHNRVQHLEADRTANQTWVAREKAEIAGYCRAVKGDEFNEIVTLYLLPKWQSKGVGSRLLRRALEWLGDDKDVVLGVVQYNENAIRFYEKFGFELGERIHHDAPTFPSGKDLPEVAMRLKKGAVIDLECRLPFKKS